VHHLLLVHTIKGLHSSGQMLASGRRRRKDGVGRTITFILGSLGMIGTAEGGRSLRLILRHLRVLLLILVGMFLLVTKTLAPNARTRPAWLGS
jgi:hypothetical protein